MNIKKKMKTREEETTQKATNKKKQTNKQEVKSARGRKKGGLILGIVKHHGRVLKFYITLYREGAFNQTFDTGMAALARYLHELNILVRKCQSEYIPLKEKSIRVMLCEEWKEMRDEEAFNKGK